jgi:hypothetical protein
MLREPGGGLPAPNQAAVAALLLLVRLRRATEKVDAEMFSQENASGFTIPTHLLSALRALAQVKWQPYKNFTKRSFRASRTGRPLPWPQECSEHASEYSATHST